MTTETTPPKRRTPKWLAITFLLVLAGVIALPFIPTTADDREEAIKREAEKAAAAKFLPNADSGELTANLEKRGFKVNRNHGEGHTSWLATSEDAGLQYTVSYGSSEIGKIEDLSAQVIIDPAQKTIEAGLWFIGGIAVLPFQGDESKAVGQWIEANYAAQGNHADTVGAVEVSLMAPSEFARMVRLRKLR